jgi:hypothetical protein
MLFGCRDQVCCYCVVYHKSSAVRTLGAVLVIVVLTVLLTVLVSWGIVEEGASVNFWELRTSGLVSPSPLERLPRAEPSRPPLQPPSFS